MCQNDRKEHAEIPLREFESPKVSKYGTAKVRKIILFQSIIVSQVVNQNVNKCVENFSVLKNYENTSMI